MHNSQIDSNDNPPKRTTYRRYTRKGLISSIKSRFSSNQNSCVARSTTDTHKQSGKHWNTIFSAIRHQHTRFACDKYAQGSILDESVIGDVRLLTAASLLESPDQVNVIPKREPEGFENQIIEAFPRDTIVPRFLNEFCESTNCWAFKVLTQFFTLRNDRVINLQDDRAWAWLDDRELSSGLRREHGDRLDYKGLYDQLKEKVS